jgi:hypothetical protein
MAARAAVRHRLRHRAGSSPITTAPLGRPRAPVRAWPRRRTNVAPPAAPPGGSTSGTAPDVVDPDAAGMSQVRRSRSR